VPGRRGTISRGGKFSFLSPISGAEEDGGKDRLCHFHIKNSGGAESSEDARKIWGVISLTQRSEAVDQGLARFQD